VSPKGPNEFRPTDFFEGTKGDMRASTVGTKGDMSKKDEESMIDSLGIPRQRGETIIKNLAEVGNIMLDRNYITKQLEKLERI
jgi:hypothetical protein